MALVSSYAAPEGVSATLHAVGDAVGGLLEFPQVGGENESGYLVHVMLVNTSDLSPDLRLFLFPERGVVAADNAALDLSPEADQEYLHVIDVAAADWKSVGGGVKVASVSNLVLPIIGDAGRIYGQIQVVTAAYTPTASDELSVTIYVQEDLR